MSTKTGIAPTLQMAPAVAKKVKGDVITSSPGLMSAAIKAAISASDPEETPTAYLDSQYVDRDASKSSTFFPKINCLASMIDEISLRISSLIG